MGFFSNLFGSKYKSHPEAMIVSCFFNSMDSSHRLEAFKTYYASISHLNHRIIECTIDGAKAQLTDIVRPDSLIQVSAKSLLWHKEALLNKAVSQLPERYKYIFWVDADVLFSNRSWLTDSVKKFEEGARILQPFEFAFHLGQGEKAPTDDRLTLRPILSYLRSVRNHAKITTIAKTARLWQSFASVYADVVARGADNYDAHGHVGLAWGAVREVFEKIGLYDKALIGGADHIMAHAAVGQINSNCITRTFVDEGVRQEIATWSRRFCTYTQGKISYVEGDVFHLWHGDLEKREYFNRIRAFTPKMTAAAQRGQLTQNTSTGLYETDDDGLVSTMTDYMIYREIDAVAADTPVMNPFAVDDTSTVAVADDSFQGFGGGGSGGAGATIDFSDPNDVQNGSTFS
jgi:hypothetical protein